MAVNPSLQQNWENATNQFEDVINDLWLKSPLEN
jgi:hypothetical protein